MKSEKRQVYDPVSETPTSYVREGWAGTSPHPPMDLEPYNSTAAEDRDGRFEIVTVKPRSLPGLPAGGRADGSPITMQAPHIDVSVFARGMLHRCVTRIDIHLQGESETVFFAV